MVSFADMNPDRQHGGEDTMLTYKRGNSQISLSAANP
jgi:hypothetical protein